MTGEIYIARVIHGGLADRSGEKSLTVMFFLNLSSLFVSLIYHTQLSHSLYVYITYLMESPFLSMCFLLKVFCMLVIGWWK